MLKTMVTDIALMPTYASRFVCIGGDCEDTCCAGWGVALDRESFLRYHDCQDPVLRPLFLEHVQENPSSKSSRDFGHIAPREDACRSCGLLSDRRLCLIQERLGEEALSDICAHYPRTFYQVGELHQMALTLSCPEAARLALLAEDAFGFVGKEQTVSSAFINTAEPRYGVSLEVMEDTRALLFQILRSPDIRLADRLRVVGHFCERLTEMIRLRRSDDIPTLLLELEEALLSGAAMAPFAGMQDLLDVQAQVAAALSLLEGDAIQSPHVQRILGLAAAGLGYQGSRAPDAAALVAAYERGFRRLGRALESVPWLLEHFLLNEVLRTLFPWGLAHPKRQFATLVVRFATVRLILVGRAAGQVEPMTPLELAETVQAACRRYVHDENYNRNLGQLMAKMGGEDLDLLCSLV